MSEPARSLETNSDRDRSLRKFQLQAVLSEQVSFFRQFVGRSEELVTSCADVVYKENRCLTGTKFPLALILEALSDCEKRAGISDLSSLALDLQEHFAARYAQSGFNYFDDASYLPMDLDTASCVARLLGHNDARIRTDYEQIIRRNHLGNGIVPTWLDTADHKRWFAGDEPFHLDVLLNHWLTELEFGRPVDTAVLGRLVDSHGLRNYWYLPPLYTPYLYSRLLRRLELQTDSRFMTPLLEVLEQWDQSPATYRNASNSCSFEKMILLLSKQPVAAGVDHALQYSIAATCGDMRATPQQDAIGLTEGAHWETPLYWSLGFKAFGSELVNRAVAILCLLESIQNLSER